ncbi:MAG: V-type ATP synthase subunit E family protein [Clostridia bacterium]
MTGNEKIIEKILADANATADKILTDAQVKVNALTAKTQAECDKIAAQAKKESDAEVGEMLKRRQTVADLDIKKALLSKRKALMNIVSEKAIEKLRALPREKYKAIVTQMIEKNAEDGDIVTIAQTDKDILTADFVASVAKSLGVKLTLNKSYGEFAGGVVLQSKNVDKNLTFEVELNAIRNEVEPQIAEILFS